MLEAAFQHRDGLIFLHDLRVAPGGFHQRAVFLEFFCVVAQQAREALFAKLSLDCLRLLRTYCLPQRNCLAEHFRSDRSGNGRAIPWLPPCIVESARDGLLSIAVASAKSD